MGGHGARGDRKADIAPTTVNDMLRESPVFETLLMNSLITLLVALAAAGIGLWIGWLLQRTRLVATIERLAAREVDNERLVAAGAALEKERADLSVRLSTANAELAAERAAATERLKSLQEAHERLTNEFKALSADALARNNQSFLELARESFGQLRQQSAGDLEQRRQAIAELVKPLRESLEKVDGKIGLIEKARAEAYGSLGEQLKSLSAAQGLLQSETARLSTALRSTATAGTWGELQLRRVVELAGMTAYCDFYEQESITLEAGRLRPDMVLRMPGDQHIVIDAKAPNEAYREAVTATDETVRAQKMAEHAAKVRGHIDALGAKAYWEQFQPSPEFVVLFLPGDQFLAGALQGDPGLVDRAISKKVLLATPSSLIALLKAAAYGWRQEAVSKNAEEISALGRQLHDRICTFAEHLEKVGKGLDAAARAYNAAIGSFESSVLPGGRKFVELGAKGTKALPDETRSATIETPLRELTRRD